MVGEEQEDLKQRTRPVERQSCVLGQWLPPRRQIEHQSAQEPKCQWRRGQDKSRNGTAYLCTLDQPLSQKPEHARSSGAEGPLGVDRLMKWSLEGTLWRRSSSEVSCSGGMRQHLSECRPVPDLGRCERV